LATERLCIAAPPNKSLHASGGGVLLNLLGTAEDALIRAAASTPSFGGCHLKAQKNGMFNQPMRV
jgi:hypothetical protein